MVINNTSTAEVITQAVSPELISENGFHHSSVPAAKQRAGKKAEAAITTCLGWGIFMMIPNIFLITETYCAMF